MTDRTNNQRILDNHGYITQSGDILKFKDAKIKNLEIINPNNSFKEILKILFIKPILNKKIMLELSGIKFLFLILTRILFCFFILSSIFIPLFYPSNNYVGMLIIIFTFFILSLIICYRLFYFKEIPNDETIETIKDE